MRLADRCIAGGWLVPPFAPVVLLMIASGAAVAAPPIKYGGDATLTVWGVPVPPAPGDLGDISTWRP